MKRLPSIKLVLGTSLFVFGVTQNAIAASTMVTDADGTRELWTFQEILGSQKLLSKIDQDDDNRGIVQTWDANGNLLTRTDEIGRIRKYTYNATNQRDTLIEAFGTPDARMTSYEYVSADVDLIKKTISPSIHAPNFKEMVNSYDARLNITAVTVRGFDAQGAPVSRATNFGYDQYGKVTTIDGPRTDVNDITVLKYYDCNTGSKCGQLEKVTNALGHITTYDEYDAAGRLKETTDSNGVVTQYSHHPRGWLLSMTQTPSVGLARVTTYDYDNVGQVTKTTLPDGSEQNYVYDAAHDLVMVYDNLGNRIEYKYDSRGNRTHTSIIDPVTPNDPDGTLVRQTETVYNHRNFIESINNGGSVTKLINDAVGNLSEHRDPKTDLSSSAVTNSHQFDALNRLESTVDALLNNSAYGYNVADQLSHVTAPNGAVTQYFYDDLGNQTKEISPDRGTVIYDHDDAGNVISMKDARNVTAIYVYDELNRLTSISYSNSSEDVKYEYDLDQDCGYSIGRLCQVIDAVGTHRYLYNPWGNVLNQTWQTQSNILSLSYKYDNVNRLTRIEYPSGLIIDYVRDVIGRVSAVHSPAVNQTEIIADQFSYRADGLVSGYRLGNSQISKRYYDLQGRLTSQDLDGVELANYVYDDNGNVEQKNDSDHQRTFYYDVLNRLYSDDWLGGVLSSDWQFSYDANGNRISQQRDTEAVQTLEYSPVSNTITEVNNSIILADLSGNITSMPSNDGILDLSYNQQNHLATATRGEVVTYYGYNHQRQRLIKAQGIDTSNYLYDLNGRLIAAFDDQGAVHEEYVYANQFDMAPIHHRLYDDTENSSIESRQALVKSEESIIDPVNSEGQCEGYERTEAERTESNVLHVVNDTSTVPVGTDVFDIPPPTTDISWFIPILMMMLEEIQAEQGSHDLTDTSEIITTSGIDLTIVDESDTQEPSDELEYIVDVATTKRSLNNGADIARHCVQQGQSSVNLNNIPLNGTHIYIRVWSKKVNGDWSYEDYEIETEAKTPKTRQVTRSYIVKDHLDTPRFIYDDEKVLTWRWASDSFGLQTANDDPDGDGYQVNFNMKFAGQYEDLESGLVYNWNRYYDPKTGRYVTSDPIGLDGGMNTFGYVGGNPLAWSDFEGLHKGDRWYGRNNRDFQRWFHQCWKQAGDPDAGQEGIEEAFQEWLSRGSPKGGRCFAPKNSNSFSCGPDSTCKQVIDGLVTGLAFAICLIPGAALFQ